MILGSIDLGAATIAAAVIAAGVATITALVGSYLERRSARTEAFRQELRTRVAAAFQLLFLIQHAMEWVTWHAVERPLEVTQRLRARYEEEVHEALPAVLGALAQVAALSRTVYELTRADTQYIFSLDLRVARALDAATASPASGADALERLAALNTDCKALYIAMPVRVTQVMDVAQRVTFDDAPSEAAAVPEQHIPDSLIDRWVNEDRLPTGGLADLTSRVASAIQGRGRGDASGI